MARVPCERTPRRSELDRSWASWSAWSGRRPAGQPYELYHNTPDEVAADRLVTDIHLPLEP